MNKEFLKLKQLPKIKKLLNKLEIDERIKFLNMQIVIRERMIELANDKTAIMLNEELYELKKMSN